MQDRRRHERRMCRHGVLMAAGGSLTIGRTIDWAEAGCKVEVKSGDPIPSGALCTLLVPDLSGAKVGRVLAAESGIMRVELIGAA